MSSRQLTSALAVALLSSTALAQVTSNIPARNWTLELKLGRFKPRIDRERSLTGNPYQEIFGSSSMLLFEMEVDRILWQKFGALGVGLSAGYAEKYAPALISPSSGGGLAYESTALKVVPIRLLGVYRFDYPALHMNIPLVPYVKAALIFTPWWVTKGGDLERVDGSKSLGAKWGYGFTGGMSLLLDFFEPRFAKDFTTDMGVVHSYLFAEYIYENVNNFGSRGLDLSSRHWMFGFSVDY
jgi:hypothetical protein